MNESEETLEKKKSRWMWKCLERRRLRFTRNLSHLFDKAVGVWSRNNVRGGKKIQLIGDNMLLIARVVKIMMSQSPIQRITNTFLYGKAMEKITKLSHIPCITSEATHTTHIASIGTIIKHIGKTDFPIVNEFQKIVEALFTKNDFVTMKEAVNNQPMDTHRRTTKKRRENHRKELLNLMKFYNTMNTVIDTSGVSGLRPLA
ncbi:unnamed protein product [Caenorhabditis sp. 36 PRJEB53466]|nr:unnamed protein product [Caenorhabditis sp. 36 PRJEB53466]